VYFLLVLLSGNSSLYAQVDTSITIPTIEVQSTRLRVQPVGGRTETWQKANLQNSSAASLADLLSNESGVFIKSYGLGSIATTAIRGASAGHTAVIWNGFALQSPQLGLLDISLMPVGMVDEVSIDYGGNATLWGSGAIGGLVTLNNKNTFQKQFFTSVQLEKGSFGQGQEQVNFKIGKKNWTSSTRLFHQKAENDFSYSIRSDLPKRTQTNAGIEQVSILQEYYIQLSEKEILSVYGWWQHSDRNIPPTSTQNKSEATQADDFLRTAIHWKRKTEALTLEARLGYFKEDIDYQDSAIGLQALSGFQSLITEVEGQWQRTENLNLHWGLNHTFTTAKADGYERSPIEHRTALFAAILYQRDHWKAQLNMRQELVNEQLIPFVPSLGMEARLSNNVKLKAKISRNYRLPTLNDRFWQPGGNPDLLTEQGWSQDLTFHSFGAKNTSDWSYTFTVFNRNIDNWILWSIQQGDNYWSANNITKVWSRGLEQRIKWNYTQKDWQVNLMGGYDYIRSTNEVELLQPKIAKGEQLIYVPTHQAFGKLQLGIYHWQLSYRHTYTGATKGVNDNLANYQIGDVRLQYTVPKTLFTYQFYIQINNLWNATYRVVERRPMPGRHFRVGIFLSRKKVTQ